MTESIIYLSYKTTIRCKHSRALSVHQSSRTFYTILLFYTYHLQLKNPSYTQTNNSKKIQAYKKIRRTFIKKKMLMTTDHKTFLKRECAVLKRTLSLIALNGKTRCNFPKCSLNACAVLCAKVHGTLRETA